MQRYIFDQETAFANTPQIVPFGVTMVGPVIIEFGTKNQKEKFLPKNTKFRTLVVSRLF